jgi:pSer/pThr/pTyr-binding forkhead associated (FHA) protein
VSCNGKLVRTMELNGRILIGRNRDNDLFLPSRYLSRHHAAILPMAEGHYYIVDLNSANGVLVNGKLVDRSLLYNGDVVSLGQFRLKVELNEVPAEEPALPDRISVDETEIMPMPAYEAPAVRISKS